MTIWFADSTFATVLWLIVKATAFAGFAAIVQMLFMRRASAAARHLVWMSVLVCLLLLPVVSRILPAWEVPVAVASVALQAPASRTAVVASSESPAPSIPSAQVALTPSASNAFKEPPSLASIAAWIYAAGVVVLLMYWFAQRWQVRRFIRQATIVDEREWIRLFLECSHALGVARPVRLLESRERNVPLALGTRRPAIVVPLIAETWDEDRRRAVLLHELAHVARFDCFTHSVALAACAVYWFHPGVWWIAKRIRIERELACDDRVIAAGTEPREYASHLLEI